MSLYPQAPQSIGKVLDAGFSMYRAVFKAILPLSFVVAIVAGAPQILPYLFGGNPQDLSGASLGTFAVGFLVWLALYMALYAGWIKSMDGLARGGAPLAAGAAFSAGLPKVLPLLGGSLLFVLVVAVGCLLLLIPGIILMFSLMFFTYLVVLEDKGVVDSLKTSHGLVWGNWWRTVAILTVGGLIYMVVFVVVLGLAGVVLGMSLLGSPTPEQLAAGPGTALVVLVVLQTVVTTVMLPMINSLILVTFRDLQLRKAAAPAGSS